MRSLTIPHIMAQPVVDSGSRVRYHARMSEEENKKNAESCDPCDCEKPEQPEQEYAEAVDESQAEEATAAVDELTKWRELALRTAAEYDNYRKRCVKDREEFTRYATRSLLEELLPVVDNFEMGMQMAGKDPGSMIYIGMSMVQKQLTDFLTGQGVEYIPTEPGQMFDHNIHEAIQSEPSDQPEGTILRVLRKGYNLKGRLLRPANVVTAAPIEEGK
ncbi:MAG: nucleotide exchange factor GrpE [Akkermansia sp.]|nr:nucleotide exchange factor GrpE [Akkermansia sp.]